jgi:hypothetical protein
MVLALGGALKIPPFHLNYIIKTKTTISNSFYGSADYMYIFPWCNAENMEK